MLGIRSIKSWMTCQDLTIPMSMTRGMRRRCGGAFHAILPHWLLGALLRTPFKTKSAQDEPQSSSESPNLPPSPRELLQHREHYEIPILERRVDHDSDTPLAALYRIYEHIVLDQNIEIRNELEAFWFHSSWKVSKIPERP
jgi:hypothetical protein